MKLKQQARVLQRKSINSLTVAVTAFNSPVDQGRATQVLLHLQHAFEMLLKAALVQNNAAVFDPKTGRSVGFAKCIELARQHPAVGLSEPDAGTLRAIDAMRDDEQHWFNLVDEQLLYLHARAGVTIFDELLGRVFDDSLAAHLPERVLPISTKPPAELDLLLDQEYSQIKELLAPGRRYRHEARARIRTMLALESHVDEESRVSSKDVDRVEKGIREGEPRSAVFPRLESLDTELDGSGVTVTVHFTKKQGVPVVFTSDETAPAAAVREVDLQKKFYMSAGELASRLGLTRPRSKALRDHLGIDGSESDRHRFTFGSQKHDQFSDNALRKMQEALRDVDMARVWVGHKPRGRGTARTRECTVQGCALAAS